MIQRPNTCEGCPLHKTSVPGFCPDKIPVESEILFVAEAPGKNEIIKGEPMVGQAGFVLKNWLMPAAPQIKIADEQGKVGIANVLRCLPKEVQGKPYPKGQDKRDAERMCRQYDHMPTTVRTVILFGENAQHLHFGPELEEEDAASRTIGREPKGVMGRIGRVVERDGIRWVFAPHPAYILRQPSLVQHGQEVLKIAANNFETVVPDILPWHIALQEIH